jgi:energy-coupling factor transport system substrate-specific component
MTKSPRNTPAMRASLLFLLASAVGAVAFLYPFILPAIAPRMATPDFVHSGSAPAVFAAVSCLCLVVLVAELAALPAPGVSAAKVAALLGAIVAVDATLRLVPSLGGASAIFLLIILAGAVFGARLGFLTGSLTLLLSALLTGGIGPWLPYQMLGAGWVGAGAGLLPHLASRRRLVVVLALYGVISALAYGALLSLTSWPLAAPGLDDAAGLYWDPSLGLATTLRRYATFYLVTSLGHDLLRAAGNALLIVTLGAPLFATLERAHRRIAWRPTAVAPPLSQAAAVRARP